MQIEKLQKRIEKIKTELHLIGEMRPGSLNKQYTKCGRANCRCQDLKNPKRHGPYYQLSYVHHGKSTTQFIKGMHVKEVKTQLANYKKFRALTAEWIDIALDLAKTKLKIDKESHA
jgi:hypothetical protein